MIQRLKALRESTSGPMTMDFEDEDATVVPWMIEFLYRGSITNQLCRSCSESSTTIANIRKNLDSLDSIEKLFRLWTLAFRLKFPKLQNETIRLLCLKLGFYPSADKCEDARIDEAIEWANENASAPLSNFITRVFWDRVPLKLWKQPPYNTLPLVAVVNEMKGILEKKPFDIRDFYVEE
ncbi:uncharacterized protein BDZ99DRAFT_524424 [Mytilinidion resinicola]|uniref:BTB domain-containing protein n=1 Tax=Mytilinidion resinicola TaxID=574789 RepID=A0A6A6Y9F8_9PEZI|nr:uncharacterized protein BDZ99DRAFT_524424 [Mytilinidion resinicola]KAF2805451.1 hypothetical protein BDZ99DRAFT_524424 [Mytilinidion resinicola]